MKKHSVKIAGHSTSVSLEESFWDELHEMAETQELTLAQLITKIDEARGDANLSSALRVYVLKQLQARIKILNN